MLPLDVLLDECNVFVPDVLWYAGGDALTSPQLPGFTQGLATLFGH